MLWEQNGRSCAAERLIHVEIGPQVLRCEAEWKKSRDGETERRVGVDATVHVGAQWWPELGKVPVPHLLPR